MVGFPRKDSGSLEVFCSDGGAKTFKTVHCVHCGGHFVPTPGSGKVRGFCQNCNGFVCGPSCDACIPMELMLENMEKGRPLEFKPIVVPAGG